MWHDIEQSDDSGWMELRAGKVTGSSIAKVMANYGKAFGDPAKKLAIDMALHRIRGYLPSDSYSNEHMQRGHVQEPIARALYEDEMFYTVTNGGFFDNGFTGCSPDGLVDLDGVIEIKSVIASTHFKTVARDDVDPAYKWQVVFNLLESGRQWIDFISYCADYPQDNQLFVKRKTKDDCYEEIKQMSLRLIEFKSLVDESELLINQRAA